MDLDPEKFVLCVFYYPARPQFVKNVHIKFFIRHNLFQAQYSAR